MVGDGGGSQLFSWTEFVRASSSGHYACLRARRRDPLQSGRWAGDDLLARPNVLGDAGATPRRLTQRQRLQAGEVSGIAAGRKRQAAHGAGLTGQVISLSYCSSM